MEFFRNLTIARKLAIAFTLTTVATVGMGAFAVVRLKQATTQLNEMSQRYMPAVQLLESIRADLAEIRIAELSQLSHLHEPAFVAEYNQRIADQRAKLAEHQKRYEALPASDEQKRLYGQMLKTLEQYLSAHAQMEKAVADGQFELAQQISNEHSRVSRRDLFSDVEKLSSYVVSALDSEVALADATQARSTNALFACMALLGLLSVALGVVIVRAIVRPLKDALRAADEVATGRLDGTIDAGRGDEVGQLLASMQRMQHQLKAVIAAQSDMAREHDQGQISYRIDESRFPGEYGRMVREVNALVAQHIGVKMRVVEVMRHYARGDLSVDMDRLPGEKAAITDAMDGTKASLSAINNEIKRLSRAAAAGDFSQRGDIDRYEHDFREMVGGLNALMQTTEDNLGHISRLLQAIAEGDLTRRVEGDFHGIFARMRDDGNASIDQLASIVSGIQAASGSISLSASEIATGNSDLSRRTETQAANLEETAASMEELTSTVRQNAEHARQADQLARGAADVAAQGGEVVGRVVNTMSSIEQSSQRIADIISVIDGIAFQTNILALNAAVEAARAGDQGRGFAVVASEVRTLAQRSAGAAKEIKGLIEDSVDKVGEGSQLVRRAGSTMDDIVASVQRVTTIMADIAAASQEQTAGIEQVNQTVMQMDESTQQNAALVEEASAAARSMEDQARQLTDAVAQFRLSDAVSASLARVAASVPPPAAPRPRPTLRAIPGKPAAHAPVSSDEDWQEF
ncbi:methyl-accepting chemotaxis protein [Stenotrophomonas sp. MH1]|uniref:Methyl-accepting chemotaxis protein n=1 Tax=Stenotrophomonas capsici TaxID=3110230 RepID=A0ABU5V0E9_9GAMM|nr:methyl-accepting chemotaxis protein [Stenotrophomonas sp. MH1]MEA5666823.1 methyl-accepting chemotaxis protein [Stenotrophomonas sp. MH1]